VVTQVCSLLGVYYTDGALRVSNLHSGVCNTHCRPTELGGALLLV